MTSKRLKRRHTLAERWFHWINAPILMAMIWSGVLIYWANDVYRVGFGSHTLFKFFPQWFYTRFSLQQRLSEGMAWHFVLAWIFGINGVAYVLYLLFSGQWRHFWPRRDAIIEALKVVWHDSTHLRPNLETTAQGSKFNAAQQLSYGGIILLGALSLVSGIAILKPIQASLFTTLLGGYEVARWLHFWTMLGFCGFIFIHVLQVLRAGWNTLRAMLTGYAIEIEHHDTGEESGNSLPRRLPAVAPDTAKMDDGDHLPAAGTAGGL